VARIKLKEKIWLFDESGTNYLARVEKIDKDITQLSILKKMKKEEPRVKITLAQALLKSKKMDMILQKSTELGVKTIIPVITARTVVKINGKIENKMERWKKITLSASKQSQRSHLPLILSPVHLKDLIKRRNEEKKLLLSENKGKYLKEILIQSSGSEIQKGELPFSVLVLVGPEGGWEEEEEEYILNNGFEAVNLGSQILRAETAAFCSLALISHFWNI
jgi:16S rRNA (uracil1498-N3)-methyltransferase